MSGSEWLPSSSFLPWHRLQDRYLSGFNYWEESPRKGPGVLRNELQHEWSVLFEHCAMATGHAVPYRSLEFHSRICKRAREGGMTHKAYTKYKREERERMRS